MRLNKELITRNRGSLENLSIGPLEDFVERVVQFGEGNFLRAFVDWQLNELNRKGLFKGKVIVVQPLDSGQIDVLNEQDGLYTVLMRGIENGKQTERAEIVTCISRGINPYSDWKGFLKIATLPSLRYIVSNTTEAGIKYSKVDFPENDCPATFPAKLTAFLYQRFKAYNGSDEHGFIVIPCELIENNGTTLKDCVLRHSNDWGLGPDFDRWVTRSNYFCNTLVDRIVPGYPKDEIQELTKKLGYEDKLLVAAELFHLWVIHGDSIVKKELPFADAGLNVVWTDDITPYRTLKVRILNGAHTLISIPSFLAGNDTVKQTMDDALVRNLLYVGLFSEILPTLDFEEKVKKDYAEKTLERFRNPFVKHYLTSIMLNTVSKFKVRVLPSLLSYHELNKKLPRVLTFSLSSLIAFYCQGKFAGQAQSGFRNYTRVDDSQVLDFFDKLVGAPVEVVVDKVLANRGFWGGDLTAVSGLKELVSEDLKSILKHGMRDSINEILKETKSI